METTQRLVYDLTQPELADALAGQSGYRVKQVWQGLYHHLWDRPEAFSMLPQDLRRELGERFSFANLQPATTLTSQDGQTIKTLFHLPDGSPLETVLMRYEQRRTLCISTQSGCAMGCVFCATGQMGFRRHLSSGEIVEQVLYFARQLRAQNEELSNIVVMGMGEPFHNYEATLAAIDRLNDRGGLNLGARRFTISTVGLVPSIRRFANEGRQINLAISLHAATDELRTSLLPINRKYPLSELFAACREYIEKTGRRISFEWALIQGINDTPEQAHTLTGWLQQLRHGSAYLCHVNVIPLNPTTRYSGHASTTSRANTFQEALRQQGIPCSIRLRRGIEIRAGCGQLAAEQTEGKG